MSENKEKTKIRATISYLKRLLEQMQWVNLVDFGFKTKAITDILGTEKTEIEGW